MNIAISGATGFIGSHLSDYFSAQGHVVKGIGREYFESGREERLVRLLSDADVVVNLGGAPIDRRWTKAYKQTLYESRILSTRKLVEAINTVSRTGLLISASAVGYYPSTGCYDEYTAKRGEGFLADLCGAWESEAGRVAASVRLALTRFGVVLAPDGGAFPLLSRSVRLGMAAVVAPGDQPFSWIALLDLIRGMEFIIRHPELKGAFNFVSPERMTNEAFAGAMAEYYRVGKVKVPEFVFRLLYGEGASFSTQGQCVIPAKLMEAGFRFRCPSVGDFFKQL